VIDPLVDAAGFRSASLEDRLLEVVMPGGSGYALMIEAYFDESGTHHGSPLMCVAGYLIESDQCRRFQAEWEAVLSRHGVPYFHMSECAHGVGIFKEISKKDRSEICRSLIETIKLRAELGIAVSVSEAEYRSIVPAHFKLDAYSFCLHYCLQGVAAWASKYDVRVPISYFFESGHKNQSVANSFINWIRHSRSIVDGLRYHSHSFVSGKKLCGIAAADLLAWEFVAAYKNTWGPKRRPVRLSFQNLMNKTHVAMHFRAEALQEYFELFDPSKPLGQQVEVPEKVRRFTSSRDFPGKPLGAL
jgi:hypothetical protein